MKKLFLTLFIVVAILAAPGGSVFAGKIENVSLGAQSVVDSVNKMNGGTGMNFYASQNGPAVGVRVITNWLTSPDSIDLGAYANTGANHDSFTTINLDDQLPIGGMNYGKLNYSDGMTSSQKFGVSLNVGSAYLYKFLAESNSIEDMQALSLAIRFNQGCFGWNISEAMISEVWNSNAYLQMLLGINDDRDFWTTVYDPDAYYDEIGNNSIFIMNITRPGEGSYEALFITGAANPYDGSDSGDGGGVTAQTPEPTTLMLLGTGLIALPFARRFLQNRQKK